MNCADSPKIVFDRKGRGVPSYGCSLLSPPGIDKYAGLYVRCNLDFSLPLDLNSSIAP